MAENDVDRIESCSPGRGVSSYLNHPEMRAAVSTKQGHRNRSSDNTPRSWNPIVPSLSDNIAGPCKRVGGYYKLPGVAGVIREPQRRGRF